MANDVSESGFGALLRQRRLAAGLTQEALAERAGLGVRSIQGLERGQNRPQRDTAERLATALDLDAASRARFLVAATPLPRDRSSAAYEATARPPVAAESARTNLPAALTSFVGRVEEIAILRDLVGRTRLLTLTGSGGVGKTRLALALADSLVDHHSDGVWLVELAAVSEPGLVPDAVAQVLGVREEADRTFAATLIDYLKDRRLLLVLDNCEHLVAACAALTGALLRACPHLHVLATSREALAVAGEQRYRVPSLPVPNLVRLPPPEQLAESAAVALFVARAQERRPDFALTAHNARIVAVVCTQLDGIPLAIELAAARVDSLGVEGIAARLDDRFRLLTGGPRTVLPRQRTLRAALDWSYDLLSLAEQALLDRLSVFAGGCTLAAAESVCGGDGLEHGEILDLLGSLVNKSLIQAEEAGGEVRYGLLETVRQYGQERLAAAGGAERLRDRHLAWYLALAEAAAPHLRSLDQTTWLDRLEVEHDNLRAALRWAKERGATEEALRLAGALGFFWLARGNFGEGRSWLEGALAAGEGGSGATRARAIQAVGDLAHWQGNFREAAARFEQSLALYQVLGDTNGVAFSLHGMAIMVERQGDYTRAMHLHEESLALYREVGNREGIATSLDQLAWVAHLQGEYESAAALYEESRALHREVGTLSGVAYCLNGLGCVAERQGTYVKAATLQEEALVLWQAVGSGIGITWSLVNLGWALLAQGEDERATAVLEESLPSARQSGYFHGVPYALSCLGWAVFKRGEYTQAAALQEEALAHLRQVGYRWGIARVLAALGCVVQARGEYGQAATYLNEGLQLSHAIGARNPLAEALEGMTWLAVATGQATQAARLGGATEALWEALGAALHPVLRPGHEQAVQAIRSALGEEAFTAAWAEGQELSLEEAVALALEGHADEG